MSTLLTAHPVIEQKARLIGEMVTESLEMAIFKQAEHDLQADVSAQSLLGELQAKQAQNEQVEDVLARLENLDVVRRFSVAQENLSEVVTRVTTILAAHVADRLDLVTEKKGGGCSACPGTGCPGSGTSDACESEAACTGADACTM